MLALRPASRPSIRLLSTTFHSCPSTRLFHSSPAIMVKVGDSIPSVELMEGSPGNKIDLAKTLTGKGLIIGVPAAFSAWNFLQYHRPAKHGPSFVHPHCGKSARLLNQCVSGPGCSETHIPGYINSSKTKTAGDVYVVSVNDAFVMKAWGKTLDPSGDSKVRRHISAPSHFLHFPMGL